MIENFGNKRAEKIWEGKAPKDFPRDLLTRTKALLTVMESTSTLNDLKILGQPPALKLHKLHGDREGELAIWIKNATGWRITFRFKDAKFLDVKVEDYH